MQFDNYLPVIAGVSPDLRKGRSILDGYTRGWGLEYGDLKNKILADPLYVRSVELAAGRTIQDEVRRMNIFLILKYYLRELPPGNIIEFGSYRGGSCIFMAAVCAALGLKTTVYGLDTFAGMPATDKAIDAHTRGDFHETDVDELRRYTQQIGLRNVEFLQGPFEETAPNLLPKIAPVTLAHIDCDILSSVAYSYGVVMPYMVRGGYIVFDDAQTSSCLGATEAVEDLLIRRDSMNAEQVYPHYVFRAGVSATSPTAKDDEKSLSAECLKADLVDLQWRVAHLQTEFDQKTLLTNHLQAEVADLRAESDQKTLLADHLQAEVADLRAESDQKTLLADRLKVEVSDLRTRLDQTQKRIQELTFLCVKATRWKRAFAALVLAPLELTVACSVLGVEVLCRLMRQARPRKAPVIAPTDTTRCSIIVLSWEGKDLLAQSLPPLLKAVRFHGGDHEIIVLDNGSTDGTSEYVAECFPEVRLVRSDRNLFFSGGNNLGVQEAKNEIVVLLNNDMFVHEDFLDPLLKGFRSPEVFAVGSQVFLADPNQRREETGKTRATFNGCDLDWAHDAILPSDEEQKYVPVFWGHGGAVALHRQKYLWLGGLDNLFRPLYVEDSDLSYRAWKVGWQCLVAVDSHVVHKHRGTFTPRVGSRLVTQIVRRNTSLFIWKNFGSLRMLVSHFLRAPIRAMKRAGVPGVGIRLELKAFLGAVKRLPAALKGKVRLAQSVVRSDEEILRLISTPPEEIIRESEANFEESDCAQLLGKGWYPREENNDKGFRWTSQDAELFLRVPAETAELSIRGYVSSSSRRLVLSVNCQGQRKHLQLAQGPFEDRWRLEKLSPGAVVSVRLAVNHVLNTSSDSRTLGVAIRSITLLPSSSTKDYSMLLQKRSIAIKNASPSVPAGIEPRKVLMVCAYLPCVGVHSGGNTMFHLIRSLSKRHRLSVLSFYEQESELEHIEQLRPYCERLEVIHRGQTLDAPNPLGLIPPEIVYEFYHEGMYRLVEEYIRAYDFDLIQCEFLQMARYANVHPRIPAVLSSHELQSLAYFNRYRSLPVVSRRKFTALVSWMRMLNYEEKMLRRFSGVVVLTRPEREFLAQYAPQVRVYDHPTGVDSEFFRCSPEKPEEDNVVFVGNFRHTPNVTGILWFLEHVWPKIRGRYANARLYIVGANPPSSLQEINGQNGVTITGWVDDVRVFLQQATVFVAPIFDGVGLRGKVLEAWAMERPVVGTRLAFEGLTSDDGTICFIADDAETFAARTCGLLENEELARRMGRQARQLVLTSFSWDAFGELYDTVYRRVLETKRQHTGLKPSVAVGLEQP